MGLVCGAAGCSLTSLDGFTGQPIVSNEGGVSVDGGAADADASEAAPRTDGCTPGIAVTASSIPPTTNLSTLGVVYWSSASLMPKSEKAGAISPFIDFKLFNENGGAFGNFRTNQPVSQRYGWTDGDPVTTYGPATPMTSGWWEVGAGTGYRVSMRDIAAERVVIADVDALDGRFEASFADGSHKQTVAAAANVRVAVTVTGCDPAAILTMAIRSNIAFPYPEGDPYIVFYALAVAR